MIGYGFPRDANSDGLVGWWSFDESQGLLARDWSYKKCDGTITSTGVRWIRSTVGVTLDFDGTGYVTLPYAGVNSIKYPSISAWVKTKSSDGTHRQILNHDDVGANRIWQFRMMNNYYFQFIPFDNQGNAIGVAGTKYKINDDLWHHVVGTWDGSVIKCYVDGNLDVSTDYGGILQQTNTTNLFVGKNVSAGDSPWVGQIDNIRVYNRALLHSEVVELFQNKSPPKNTESAFGSPKRSNFGSFSSV